MESKPDTLFFSFLEMINTSRFVDSSFRLITKVNIGPSDTYSFQVSLTISYWCLVYYEKSDVSSPRILKSKHEVRLIKK